MSFTATQTKRRALARLLIGAALLVVTVLAVAIARPANVAASFPQGVNIKHVWVIVIENTSAAFDGGTYLGTRVKSQGAYIPNYYAIGHQSADNYLALISGQGPEPSSQADCPNYQDVQGTSAQGSGFTQMGQWAAQSGCVYPQQVLTVGQQFDAKQLSWKGYMEDMGRSPRDAPVGCDQAKQNAASAIADPTQNAQGPNATSPSNQSTTADQYALRHNPFMYFHANIDSPTYCKAHVVPLADPEAGLLRDLKSAATTPAYSFITPNLCNDGHDPSTSQQSQCAAPDAQGKSAGGLTSVDDFLKVYLPPIVDSPAFRQDGGMVVITADEGGGSPSPSASSSNPKANADPYSASCCNEFTAATCPCANSSSPGGDGFGGGKVGAVVLSPFIRAGTTHPVTTSGLAYNHYSLLRTIEDLFQLKSNTEDPGHLGLAGSYPTTGYDGPCDQPNGSSDPCQPDFGGDVFSDPTGQSHPNVDLTATASGAGSGSGSGSGSTSQSSSGSSASSDSGTVAGGGAPGQSSNGGGGGVAVVPGTLLHPGSAAGTSAANGNPGGAAGASPDPSAPNGSGVAGSLTSLTGPRLPGRSGGFPLILVLFLTLAPVAAIAGSLVVFRRKSG